MKDSYYMISVWKHWDKQGVSDADFYDYMIIGDKIDSPESVHNIINAFKEAHDLTGDDWDHIFSIAECMSDDGSYAGYEILESISYEEWEA
jgi:hypothetical protein